VRDRVLPVYFVKEYEARISRLPCLVYYGIPHGACLDPAGDPAIPRVLEFYVAIRIKLLEELICHANRYVEIAEYGVLRVLAQDEIHDIRMVIPEYPHIGAPSFSALLYNIGSRIEYPHE
jgi:hypothetical protein